MQYSKYVWQRRVATKHTNSMGSNYKMKFNLLEYNCQVWFGLIKQLKGRKYIEFKANLCSAVL